MDSCLGARSVEEGGVGRCTCCACDDGVEVGGGVVVRGGAAGGGAGAGGGGVTGAVGGETGLLVTALISASARRETAITAITARIANPRLKIEVASFILTS